MIDIERLKLVIETKNTFAVVSHTSPDGDSMGSILSFYNFLIEKGKRVDVFVEGQVPRKYLYLNGANEIKNVDLAQESYDCLIVLDCGDLDRLGECMPLTEKCDLIINIDHHITNTRFGNINIVDSNASSVGEMLYDIYLQLGHNISKNIAECLYTSIVSDTGGFKFSNTTSKTMNIVSKLLEKDIDFTSIYYRLFDQKTLNGIKLTSLVVSTLRTYLNGKVAIMNLTKEMLELSGATEDEAGELVNIARDIENVEVGVLIKEIDKNVYKISLRSKDYVDVKDIALKYGGGGHVKAAGCTIKDKTIEQIETILLKDIEKSLGEVI